MDGVRLDWSSADVRDGKLEVALRGEPPEGWKDAFGRTVALLPGGQWGKVKVTKGRIGVHDITDGCEDRLHHFLESVVQQANAAAPPPEGSDKGDTDDDELGTLDAAMTRRFRSFATGTDEHER